MPRLDRRELDEEWRLRAACKGKTELFFFNGQIQGYEYDAARLICRACPVLAECANWVLTAPPLLGFVAGMTERERKRARRSRRAA